LQVEEISDKFSDPDAGTFYL